MASRIVTDSAGRTWTCTAEAPAAERNDELQGRDVMLSCVTDSVNDPVQLTVGWQWETMAAPGLARLLAQSSPVPRR